MSRGEMKRGEIGSLAESVGVSPRTLCRWKHACERPDGACRPPGRPPHSAQEKARAQELVLEEVKKQGWSAGEMPIWNALQDQGVPLRLVRSALRDAKAAHRRRHRDVMSELRRHIEVKARDTIWSLDGTHLGRDREDQPVIGEAVRDVASTRTLGLTIGPPPTSAEVAALLDRVVAERGAPPLVLAVDNGPENCGEVEEWCARHEVVLLRSVPHVPQHNPWSERGFKDLKAESELGRGVFIPVLQEAACTVYDAIHRLDHGRRRATREWKTAAETDAALPPATLRVTRTDFYTDTRCAMEKAVQDCHTERQRRLAAREAILNELECNDLITTTRGPAQTRPANRT